MGFAQVGRILAEPTRGTHDDTAAEYSHEQREKYLAHCDVPTPILRAPDRSAFVDVSWFWDAPSVRIRSELTDGSAVETYRLWENPPGLPIELAKYWRRLDISKDMTKSGTPQRGRSIEIVATRDSAAQWRHHQAHVARYAAERHAEVGPLGGIEHALDLTRRIFRHDAAVERRTVGFWKPLVVTYGIIGLLLILALHIAGQTVAAIGTALGLALLTPFVVRLVISRVRILPKSLRPPFIRHIPPAGNPPPSRSRAVGN